MLIFAHVHPVELEMLAVFFLFDGILGNVGVSATSIGMASTFVLIISVCIAFFLWPIFSFFKFFFHFSDCLLLFSLPSNFLRDFFGQGIFPSQRPSTSPLDALRFLTPLSCFQNFMNNFPSFFIMSPSFLFLFLLFLLSPLLYRGNSRIHNI